MNIFIISMHPSVCDKCCQCNSRVNASDSEMHFRPWHQPDTSISLGQPTWALPKSLLTKCWSLTNQPRYIKLDIRRGALTAGDVVHLEDALSYVNASSVHTRVIVSTHFLTCVNFNPTMDIWIINDIYYSGRLTMCKYFYHFVIDVITYPCLYSQVPL